MRFVSLFAGAGGFDLGLERAGHTCIGQCEIEPTARAVLERHWPSVPKHDDVTTIRASTFEHPELVTFGSPCQDLSVAGKRTGMSEGETRSGLFYEAVRYIREVQEVTDGRLPRCAIWENVPGAYSSNGGRDFATVLALLVGGEVRVPTGGWGNAGVAFGPLGSAEWRTLDSRYFGVAQRRRRVFLVYRPGGERAGEVLLEPDSVQRDIAAGGEAREDVAATLSARASYDRGDGSEPIVPVEVSPSVLASWGHHGYSSPRGDGTDPIVPVAFSGKDSGQDAGEVAPTLRAMNHADSHANGGGQVAVAYAATDYKTGRYDEANVAEAITTSADRTRAAPIAFALRGRDDGALPEVHEDGSTTGTVRGAEGGSSRDYVAFAENSRAELRLEAGNGAITGAISTGGGKPGQGVPTVASGYAVRRLTPRECERLQAFPDDWTRYRADGTEIADTHRYRLMGNAVTTSVVEWIGRRLPA